LARFPNTRATYWVIVDDFAPGKTPKPLKTNGSEKRRNHRQKSSKVVKIEVNSLNSFNNR